MKETRKVQPCGMLYSQTREYFLLYPHPIVRMESWEKDNAYRWLVVPREVIGWQNTGEAVYSFARHIVTTAFVVDYAANMPEITIKTLAEIDIANQVWTEDHPDYVPDIPAPYTEEEWDKLLAKTDEAHV